MSTVMTAGLMARLEAELAGRPCLLLVAAAGAAVHLVVPAPISPRLASDLGVAGPVLAPGTTVQAGHSSLELVAPSPAMALVLVDRLGLVVDRAGLEEHCRGLQLAARQAVGLLRAINRRAWLNNWPATKENP